MADIFRYIFIGTIVTLIFVYGWISITDPIRIYRFFLKWTLDTRSASLIPPILPLDVERMKLMLTDPATFKAENAPLLKRQKLIGIGAIGMGVVTLLGVAIELIRTYLDA